MTAGVRLLAVVLLLAGTPVHGQIRTLQVTSTLLLDTTSYSGAMRSTYSAQFVTDVSLAISVDRGRFVLPALTTADATTSYVSFVILPPSAPNDPTALQIFNSYSNEILRPGSPLLSNALTLHLDLSSASQTTQVNVYQCGDGSYVLLINACPSSPTTAPSGDAIDSTTLMRIEIASAGVIVAVVILIVAVSLRRRQRQSTYRASGQIPAQQQQQQSSPNGMIMAKIITTDDGSSSGVPNFPNPYREVQPMLSASFGTPPPYPSFSPPMSVQSMPMMVPMQYTIGPMPTQTPYQDGQQTLSSQQGVVDPMSMSTTTAKQGQPSRIVKKGMNLKQIRQKRIGLDAPQVDQGDESMPDTDTDF